MKLSIGAALLTCAPMVLSAQTLFRVRVSDTTGVAIPYAVIEANPGGRRVADSLGQAAIELPARVNSITVQVRRIGFLPGRAVLSTGDQLHDIRLSPVARELSAVVISDRRNNLLVSRGFYDRLERVRRGAFTGEFITPEDLERLSPGTVSRALSESRYVRIGRVGGRQLAVLLGRGNCGYTILVDGSRVAGTLEENATGNTSIDPRGSSRRGSRETPPDISIEEFVNGLEIAAIEVYPSAANAPAEIQARAMGGRGACGIVAIWTGR
jgi:hypothetical protein